MGRALLLLASLALLVSGCREGASPFTPPDAFPDDAQGQLTFNPNGDHVPVWNAGSDSVYYTAESYAGFPATRGLLLSVPREGGTARPILRSIQQGVANQPWLSAPALSRDGKNIAFFQLTDVRDREFDFITCPFPPMTAFDTLATSSILQEAVLRVRDLQSTSPNDAARLTVRFVGRTFDPQRVMIVNVAHPFQRLFEGEGVPIFRASWSPDGTRLVYSDGTRLHVWTVGQANSVALAGTDDGIMPAWSPDGAWLAFSKPVRGATQRFECEGRRFGQTQPAGRFDRTVWTPMTRENAQLMLIRPDGTGLRSLGEGDSPAWTADSRTVVAHRDENLFRVSIETGVATMIANTKDAFEPAISPDGRFLAFAKRREIGIGEFLSRGNYDIWVAPF